MSNVMPYGGHGDWSTPKQTHETVIVDGVIRYPPTGINVVVVGGGIGGHSTALECWRKGHNVQLLEKNSGNSPIGDLITFGPSAIATIKHYPSMLKRYLEIGSDCVVSYRRSKDGGLAAPPEDLEYNRPGVPEHAAYPIRIKSILPRAELADMYYDQLQRVGVPVNFGIAVKDYEENESEGTATAVAEDGTRYTGDVVIAADGLGTKSFKAILGRPVPVIPTGQIVTRVLYKLEDVVIDVPNLRKEIDQLERDELRLYSGKDFRCMINLSKTTVNFITNLPDDGTAEESWHQTIPTAKILAALPDESELDPVILEAARAVPNNTVIRWKLCWRDPQPVWTSPLGRIVQVGDAAHSFIPSSVSGGTSAAEDGMCLAECLRLAGKQDAGIGMKVYNLLRFRRVAILQRMGFQNRRESQQEGGMEATVAQSGPNRPMWIGKWMWTHNADTHATANFKAARDHLEKNTPFEFTNIPPGFKWEDWSAVDEMEKQASGILTDKMKTNGDWSIY